MDPRDPRDPEDHEVLPVLEDRRAQWELRAEQARWERQALRELREPLA